MLQAPTAALVIRPREYNVCSFPDESAYVCYFNECWDARRRCCDNIALPFEGINLTVHPQVFSPNILETYATSVLWDVVRSFGVEGKTVADIGCGCGVLSILAAKQGAVKVHAFEIDSDAVENASENIHSHGVEDIVMIEQVDFAVSTSVCTFDVILISLPLAEDAWKSNASCTLKVVGSAIDAIQQSAHRRLNPGGRAFLVRGSFEGTYKPCGEFAVDRSTIAHAFGHTFWVESLSSS